jgi:hypothetical protein
VDEKSHFSPDPLRSPVGGWGKGGGASSTALKICFNKKKSELQLNYHQKHSENDIFNENL